LNFEFWNLEFWNLEFGIWNLEFGIWNLEFGIFPKKSDVNLSQHRSSKGLDYLAFHS